MTENRVPVAGIKDGDELLTVRIGRQEFGIDIMSVREIRGWVGSTPLPQSPDFIKGVVNLRGLVLPIIDLPMRLGLEACGSAGSAVVVVVEVAGQVAGLLVEAVCDIVEVGAEMLQSVPNVGATASANIVTGLLTVDTKIVSILNLGVVMPGQRGDAFDAAA